MLKVQQRSYKKALTLTPHRTEKSPSLLQLVAGASEKKVQNLHTREPLPLEQDGLMDDTQKQNIRLPREGFVSTTLLWRRYGSILL